MPSFFATWLRRIDPTVDTPRVYEELPNMTPAAVKELSRRVLEHYVGLETVARAGGFAKAADVIKNSLPSRKRIQSGDLGEVLAVELLHETTKFRAPIPKLRYKSDRDMPLHGND